MKQVYMPLCVCAKCQQILTKAMNIHALVAVFADKNSFNYNEIGFISNTGSLISFDKIAKEMRSKKKSRKSTHIQIKVA